jgi:Lipase maturation factor
MSLEASALIFSGPLLWESFFPGSGWPPFLSTAYSYIEPFRSLNGYGLFRVMTKTRPEIIIEGSEDGVIWRTYDFKYKVGKLGEAPPILAPQQPRLDWQMWFAALDDVRQEPWFINFFCASAPRVATSAWSAENESISRFAATLYPGQAIRISRSVFRLAKGMGSHGLSQKDSADCCADQDEDPGSCLPDLQTGKQNESECQALR